MGSIKKPGVYIEEKNAFPSSVVEVASAIPAFVGYTENRGKNISGKPVRINSYGQFLPLFGGAPDYRFQLRKGGDDLMVDKTAYTVSRVGTAYRLFDEMRLFFQNGGSACYFVSVGEYRSGEPISAESLVQGLSLLEKEEEPTLVLIPDAVSLDTSAAYYSLCQKVIAIVEE